jgi:ABC-type uncharacterized transport system permease subunit
MFWFGVVAAMIGQVWWFVTAVDVYEYCVLFDAWGMMGVVVLAVPLLAWWVGRRFKSLRLSIGSISVLAVAAALAHVAFPAAPGPAPHQVDSIRSLHVLLMVLGYATLILGCVAGLMFVWRSKNLHGVENPDTDVPWPALTALDRLYVRSSMCGLGLIAGGILLGILGIRTSENPHVWYSDPAVWLTLVGFFMYGIDWIIRCRQGFCNRLVIGIGTAAFCCVLLAFFLSKLTRNIHGLGL